jgi:hypothetical protein
VGLSKGRLVYQVVWDWETVARLVEWRVSCVRSPPRSPVDLRWGRARAPKRVYLRRRKLLGSCILDRDSFPLASWPRDTHFAATPKAAWGKAARALRAEIERAERCRAYWSPTQKAIGRPGKPWLC